MKPVLGTGLVLLLSGCGGLPAAPDEVALERFATANALVTEHRFAEAIPHYRFVVTHRDRMKDAWHRLAYCLEQEGRTSEAISALEGARRVDRQDAFALKHLARLYTHMGFLDEAIAANRERSALRGGDKTIDAEVARLEKLNEAKGERR